MDPKELRGLYEAYSEVYVPQEVDESKHGSIASSGGGNRRARKSADMRKPYNDTMRRQDQLVMSKGKPFNDRVKKDSPMQYKSNEEYVGESRRKIAQMYGQSDMKMDYDERNLRNRGDLSKRDAGSIARSRLKGQLSAVGRLRGTSPHVDGSRVNKEEYDIYDIILLHLLDEGYAETPEAAEAIMVNMSEEWRQSIVEEMLDEELQGKAREKGEELLKKTKGKPNSFQKNSRINWLLGKSKKHPSHEYGTVSRSAEEKGQSRAPKQTKARKGQTKKQGVKTLGGGGGNVGSYGMPQKDTLPRGKGNKAARRAGTYRED